MVEQNFISATSLGLSDCITHIIHIIIVLFSTKKKKKFTIEILGKLYAFPQNYRLINVYAHLEKYMLLYDLYGR